MAQQYAAKIAALWNQQLKISAGQKSPEYDSEVLKAGQVLPGHRLRLVGAGWPGSSDSRLGRAVRPPL